jgi:hypothetical protein
MNEILNRLFDPLFTPSQHRTYGPCAFASQRKSSIMFCNLEMLIPISDSRNFNPEAGIISQIFRV